MSHTVNPVKFSITILGAGSALPATGRNPTAQLLNVNHHYYLIDCGEGTQMQFRRFGLKMQRLEAVFISHLHGDHYFGLIGLLNSMHLLGRTKELSIIGPVGLKQIIEIQIKAARGRLRYPLRFSEIEAPDEKTEVFADKHMRVESFALKHRIDCLGFSFTEHQRERHYIPSKGEALGVMQVDIPLLKRGEDVTRDDKTIRFEDVTEPAPKPRTYSFCTDTRALDSTVEHARGANVLYHEATFESEDEKRAHETYHSTSKQAAEIALRAGVNKLIIGHFSARYKSLDKMLSEAREVFEQTDLAEEGVEFEIR